MAIGIGLLGCGTIGKEIAGAIASGIVDADLVMLMDLNDSNIEAVRDIANDEELPKASGIDDLIDASDLIVEAAGQSAVESFAAGVLESGTDLLMMSVGSLADDELRSDVESAARENAASLYMPSGAIAGLDAIKAAAVKNELNRATLQTRKPPEGLAGAPYIEENDIDLQAIENERVVFEGSAREAVKAFPSNVNVVMSLSLAGIGPDETTAKIIVDPEETRNVHQIQARGDAGVIETTVKNEPSPSNPKTSYLASLSAIERLRDVTTSMSVGT